MDSAAIIVSSTPARQHAIMGGDDHEAAAAGYDPDVVDAPPPTPPSTASDAAAAADGEADDGNIVYTDEELDAMRRVRATLMEEHGISPSTVGAAFLAVATINCKLRVDETVSKIRKLLEIMAQLGCPDGIDDVLWKEEAACELHPYPPVGRDRRGCATTWIRAGPGVTKELERAHCHACIMQVSDRARRGAGGGGGDARRTFLTIAAGGDDRGRPEHGRGPACGTSRDSDRRGPIFLARAYFLRCPTGRFVCWGGRQIMGACIFAFAVSSENWIPGPALASVPPP